MWEGSPPDWVPRKVSEAPGNREGCSFQPGAWLQKDHMELEEEEEEGGGREERGRGESQAEVR